MYNDIRKEELSLIPTKSILICMANTWYIIAQSPIVTNICSWSLNESWNIWPIWLCFPRKWISPQCKSLGYLIVNYTNPVEPKFEMRTCQGEAIFGCAFHVKLSLHILLPRQFRCKLISIHMARAHVNMQQYLVFVNMPPLPSSSRHVTRLIKAYLLSHTICGMSNYGLYTMIIRVTLQLRHNGRDGVSNHQPHDCLLNRLFKRRSTKTSKFRVTGLCVGISAVTCEFPAQMASNAENVSIWWRHHRKVTVQWGSIIS